MKITEINGLLPAQEPVGSSKKRTESTSASITDKVDISAEAKQKQSLETTIKAIKEYIAQLPPVREEYVSEVIQKLREGYTIDRQMTEAISQRILELLNL